ncbi:hypothetical protein AGMMS49975_22510 [Clostridia bacterium]|nr:hypothetical protein AGMMS49975_22510 [Clostridia bacterium]
MEVEQILADFERTQTACREMEHNKILVGIVGDVGSDVIKIAHGHEYGDGRLPERSFFFVRF